MCSFTLPRSLPCITVSTEGACREAKERPGAQTARVRQGAAAENGGGDTSAAARQGQQQHRGEGRTRFH